MKVEASRFPWYWVGKGTHMPLSMPFQNTIASYNQTIDIEAKTSTCLHPSRAKLLLEKILLLKVMAILILRLLCREGTRCWKAKQYQWSKAKGQLCWQVQYRKNRQTPVLFWLTGSYQMRRLKLLSDGCGWFVSLFKMPCVFFRLVIWKLSDRWTGQNINIFLVLFIYKVRNDDQGPPTLLFTAGYIIQIRANRDDIIPSITLASIAPRGTSLFFCLFWKNINGVNHFECSFVQPYLSYLGGWFQTAIAPFLCLQLLHIYVL